MTGVALLDQHLLSVLIALPLIGAGLLLFFPREGDAAIRTFTLLVTVVEFILSLLVVARFDVAIAGMQLVERTPWIPQYGISYIVGVDGISLWILMLTTFIMPITILSTWSAVTKNVKEFMVFMLILETAMVGVFLATDLFLFYIFWELVLIPMYFLIGVWGGERRIYAAIKFFLYTFVG
ncbi:MAG TPA: proton-conducting transporter membrane subunit, partial [Candidatus Deferrimicrobium sp.]